MQKIIKFVLTLTDYPELFEALKVSAKKNFRSVEFEAIALINSALTITSYSLSIVELSNKIYAIKFLIEVRRDILKVPEPEWGLKECKDWIDALITNQFQANENKTTYCLTEKTFAIGVTEEQLHQIETKAITYDIKIKAEKYLTKIN